MARARKLLGVGALEQAGVLSPYSLEAGSDPRYLGAAPDRTEVGLLRYKPKKGASSRVQNAIAGLRENRGGSYDSLMADIDAGLSVDADSWYNTEELRDWFVNELGEQEGNAEWTDFMNLMGATSPGNKVPSNMRVASYYRNKGPEWRKENEQPLKEGKLIPEKGSGYGHKMQRLHAQNVGKLSSGDWDSSPEPGVPVAKSKGYQNPKARGFAGSLMGGTKNIAADLHFTRLMGMASGDPDWLDTGPTISDSLANKLKETHGRKINKYLQVNKNGDTVFKAKNAVKDGLVDINEIADEPSVWSSAPNDTEYAAFEDFIYEVAQERGLTGPQAQAALWMGAAKRTGVADESQGTFMELFRNRADKRAEETGQTREQVISDFIKNRGLLSVPAMVGGAGLLASGYSPESQGGPLNLLRANDMGFRTDKPLYHGTRHDEGFDEFKPGRAGLSYFAEDIEYAKHFGPTVGEFYLKPGKQFDPVSNASHRKKMIELFNSKGGWQQRAEGDGYNSAKEFWMDMGIDDRDSYLYDPRYDDDWEILDEPETDILFDLQNEGFDSFRFYEDNNDKIVAQAVADPSRIRSVDAKFDPKKKESGKLMASVAPAPLLMSQDDAIPDWREVYGSEVNTEMPPSSFDNKLEAARALGAGFAGGILGDLSRIGGYINPFSDVDSVDADAVALQNQVVRALSGGDVSPGAQKYLEPIQQVDEAQVGTLSAIDRAMRVGGEEEADQYLKRQFPRGYGIADVLNQYINPLSY